jgi:hypothetical protein
MILPSQTLIAAIGIRWPRSLGAGVVRAAAAALLLLELAAPDPAVASTDRLAQLCDHAAQSASRETGVPLAVLRAITRTETGRGRGGKLDPWPWTVNMEGKGVWFDTEDAARAYVFRHFKRGARSFDVGCFQINYKWHGAAFASVEEMFDPAKNARYAAEFLKTLFAEFGDWTEAAGAYHSRTPEFADRYKARFERLRAALDPVPPGPVRLAHAAPLTAQEAAPWRISPADPGAPAGTNGFPLLRAGAALSGLGSLVPARDGAARAFIAISAN